MNAIDKLIWSTVAFPLADLLARWGLMKARWAWKLTYTICPAVAGLTALISTSAKSKNVFFWGWPGPDVDDDLDGLLAEIIQAIEHAPTPGGLDTYWLEYERLEALPSDKDGIDIDRADATLQQRKVIERRCIKGDRYYDWKNGQGKTAAIELLTWARPTADLPVTVVRVTVDGEAVAGVVRQWQF